MNPNYNLPWKLVALLRDSKVVLGRKEDPSLRDSPEDPLGASYQQASPS